VDDFRQIDHIAIVSTHPDGAPVSSADDAAVLRVAATVISRRAPKPDAFLARLMVRILQRMADSVERLPG
jgi:hypothetical protein